MRRRSFKEVNQCTFSEWRLHVCHVRRRLGTLQHCIESEKIRNNMFLRIFDQKHLGPPALWERFEYQVAYYWDKLDLLISHILGKTCLRTGGSHK